MDRFCYLNGKIMPEEKAKISLRDLGILRGYSVFDVMCTENGKPFLINEHWRRLQNSARTLKLKIPINFADYKKVIEKLVEKNGYNKSTIRTILSGGTSSDGFSLEKGKETFYLLIEKFHEYPKEIYEQGAKVIMVEYSRDNALAKTTNYITALKNQGKKDSAGAIEMIFMKNGIALEASTSNLFIVKKGKIITPKEEILHGITRNLVIKLAKKEGFQIQEGDIEVSELFSADEIFLTATNKAVVPVVKVDGKKIRNGKVGEVTKKIMDLFSDFIKKY